MYLRIKRYQGFKARYKTHGSLDRLLIPISQMNIHSPIYFHIAPSILVHYFINISSMYIR
jgi:hypothetical protein